MRMTQWGQPIDHNPIVVRPAPRPPARPSRPPVPPRGIGQVSTQDLIDMSGDVATPNYPGSSVEGAPANTVPADLTQLQQQVSATADVVSGILSGQYSGTTPGLAAPSSSSSLPMLLMIGGLGLVLVMAMGRD